MILSACATQQQSGSVPEAMPVQPVREDLSVSSATSDEKAQELRTEAKIFKATKPLLNPQSSANPLAGQGNISLNFEGADVREIARTVLGEILKESYIVDPKAQGTITFRTAKPLLREALLPTLESILRMNGIVMVKENGIFKIMPAASARGSLSPQLANPSAGFTLQVFPLQFVGAREMAKLLENVAADPSLVKVDEIRNLLIIAGTQNEIQHMVDTIDMFDVDWLSGMSFGLFVLQSADVKTIDQELTKIFSDKSGANPLTGVVRLVPIERLNAFVIVTTQPKYLDQAKYWLEKLDRFGTTGGTRLFVYQVQNSKAEHLADLLNQTFGSGTASATSQQRSPSVAPGLTGTQLSSTPTRPSGQPSSGLGATSGTSIAAGTGAGTARAGGTTGVAGATGSVTPVTGATLTIGDESSGGADQVRIVADPKNNALLILANSAGYEKIEAALKKLDNSPRQVLIEVTIAEVTLKDELKYGIEWLFTNGPRRGGKLDLGAEGLLSQTPGFSYAISSATSNTIKGVLNALASDNKLNILSSPHIMVADNQTAKFQVGDSVPIAGPQTVTGTGQVINSVQYLDTGVILSVTPRINAGGLVNLDIAQEVSTATTTTSSGLNSPTIAKRSATTAVSVQSGETMVLGGLISERSDNTNIGIPFLSSIPILGGAFGTQARNTNRTELVVMITPRVANNFNQAKTLSEELRRKMGDVKDLVDCGTRNIIGYSTRGGLWCLAPSND